MRRIMLFAMIVPVVIGIIGCAKKPKTFVEVTEPSWTSIEIRHTMPYDEAWEEVVKLLAKRFTLEEMSKDGGYVRTPWEYSWWWENKPSDEYRFRVIAKFSANRQAVDIMIEANYLSGGEWIQGTDIALLDTMKRDIMGVVGRTAR